MHTKKEEIEQLIKRLELLPHPEGGYFRETYRSEGEIKKENLEMADGQDRNYSTCIYFLLTSEVFSSFHRIRQDEIWHFYDGSPIKIHMINEAGLYSTVIIGNNFEKGQIPQLVVPGRNWFAATVENENDYSLVGCTVAPGFDFSDFELGERKNLINQFPQHSSIIQQLTRLKS